MSGAAAVTDDGDLIAENIIRKLRQRLQRIMAATTWPALL